MGYSYSQLSLGERIEIYRLRRDGLSLRQIAGMVQRSASTISRELRRNSRKTKVWSGGYRPDRAHDLAMRRRRWDCRFKLARQPSLRKFVRNRLAMGWSPEQIAGRLTLEQAPMRISHESIYRFIYHRVDQKDYWNRLLPKAKSRRGKLGRKGGVIQHIKHRKSLHDRPDEVRNRKAPGHWEADLMLFSKYGQAVLVVHERQSRLLLAKRQPSKEAQPVLERLHKLFASLPKQMRKTITFDNGTEFALHYKRQDKLGIKTFFCDPHAPWQKGGVENAICRLRRTLPRKSDLASVSQYHLDQLVAQYNNTPRKCLGYKTPAEVFEQKLNLLHLNRESTFRLSPE